MNVLIVEDEWIVSEELKESFLAHGAKTVIQTDNGKEAIEFICSEKLQLAVLDIMLRDKVNGLTVASKILECQKNCPIVFVSSYCDKVAYQYLAGIKPIAIFNKPFAPISLINMLKEKKILT